MARRWSGLLARHPYAAHLLALAGPGGRPEDRPSGRSRRPGVQVATGTAAPDLGARLDAIKDEAPQLAPAIRKVEQARELVRHDERWKEVHADALSLAAIDDPEKPLGKLDAFLREFPDTPRRAEALALAHTLKTEVAARRSAVERKLVDDLVRSESLPDASLADLIDQARQFLADHPDSTVPARRSSSGSTTTSAGSTSATSSAPATTPGSYPTNFATRIERYPGLPQDPPGGRPVHQRGDRGEGPDPPRVGHLRLPPGLRPPPSPTPTTSPRSPAGSATTSATTPTAATPSDAKSYLDWWDKVSVPGDYRVTLRRGEVDPVRRQVLLGRRPPTSASCSRSAA